MSDNDKVNEQLKNFANSDPMSKLLVSNILKKHGVTKDKMNKISDDEKEMILNLIKDVQEKAKAFANSEKKTKTITENNHQRTQKQNTRREQLLEQLRQRQQNKKNE
ncbi:spore coat protein [Bacillus inaquosorum]|uniref:spore coat protein n=1 Tax=Bacillus inaquosorum TaxID=483913 RepID=UPI00228143EF|nr:spore coat protein [Bacillus inaquosorum]MCY8787750.1 spore coat protein [Bacillus inaquosorum]MCY8843725.1 spore coat protein [Bacillus inaquosorum]MCY9010785.1 spore coat protein [Bacillus inaquosorum]MCY9034250.1 spore coat protein [Bacillus inaquosorum]MCY9039309.1 spore coat protein [Bacillus inaquosorum]